MTRSQETCRSDELMLSGVTAKGKTMTFKIKTASLPISISGEKILPAAVALFLGVFFIMGTGFANSSVLHNATHDARHAISFPCH